MFDDPFLIVVFILAAYGIKSVVDQGVFGH